MKARQVEAAGLAKAAYGRAARPAPARRASRPSASMKRDTMLYAAIVATALSTSRSSRNSRTRSMRSVGTFDVPRHGVRQREHPRCSGV